MIKSNSGIRKTDVINRRMFIIGAAKVVVFAGIVARLFSLQINENKKYLTLSDKNRTVSYTHLTLPTMMSV